MGYNIPYKLYMCIVEVGVAKCLGQNLAGYI